MVKEVCSPVSRPRQQGRQQSTKVTRRVQQPETGDARFDSVPVQPSHSRGRKFDGLTDGNGLSFIVGARSVLKGQCTVIKLAPKKACTVGKGIVAKPKSTSFSTPRRCVTLRPA
jgi:hypothetical protein